MHAAQNLCRFINHKGILMFANINVWGSLLGAVAVFFLGGIWYSKMLFGRVWKKECGMTDAKCKGGHNAMAFILSFLLALIAALALSWLLGSNPPLGVAIKTGLLISIFWVATSMGTNYLFTQRSFKIFLVDTGYHVAQFVIYGVIFGLWH